MAKSVTELKNYFISLANANGCVYEDDYHAVCYDAPTNIVAEINNWLLSAGLPLKKNKPKNLKKRGPSEEYKKDVIDKVKHPNVKKMASKKDASFHLNKALDLLKDTEFKTEFMPPWKKVRAQRIDEEKRMLEDTIRARQSQLPDWQQLLQKVQRAMEFSELRDIWDRVKEIPSFASKASDVFIKTVKIKDKEFKAMVAESLEQKAYGLEVVASLDDTECMLFPFDPPEHVTFHMGKVTFPIDILFLLDDPIGGYKIAKIIHNAQPGALENWSNPKTACVVEILGGACKKHGVSIGDSCTIKDSISKKGQFLPKELAPNYRSRPDPVPEPEMGYSPPEPKKEDLNKNLPTQLPSRQSLPTVSITNSDRILALEDFLGESIDPATAVEEEGKINIDAGEYLVLTDKEADDLAEVYIEESLWAFTPSFLEYFTGVDSDVLKKMQETMYENAGPAFQSMIGDKWDEFVEMAIDSDGRGHFIASYNGEENEAQINGKQFFIYRTN